MVEKMQQQYLPYGGYVNIHNGHGSDQFNLFPQVNKKKIQDVIVTQPQQ
jgi:hypothetical protein